MIKVTWRDPPDTPNRVQFSGGQPEDIVLVASTAANEALINPQAQVSSPPPYRISVEVGDATGPTSPAGLSAEFDRSLDGPAVWDSMVPHGDLLTMAWHVPPATTDHTPGDPLDSFPEGTTGSDPFNHCITPQGTREGTTYTIPIASAPPTGWQVTVGNPWGTTVSKSVLFTRATASIANPATTTYGQPVAITGGLRSTALGGGCVSSPFSGPVRKVHLQARTGTGAPWYGVGSITDGNEVFRFAPTATGARQFRVVASATSWPATWAASNAAVTSAVTSQTLAWVRSARFLDPAIRRGERSTAHVWVSPGLSTTALLQRWSPTGWVGVKQMPMTNGVAQYRFTPAATGSWRWVIPTTRAPNGLAIAWTATSPFSITVA
ncbi:hypothetical protein [Knoellia alttitudinis]